MEKKIMIGLLFILSIGLVWADPGLAQTASQVGRDQVMIHSRYGADGVVIGDEVIHVSHKAQILDPDRRPTTLDRISFPVEAVVGFGVDRQGEVWIEFIKVEDLPR
jgi:hypothetical protein